jgi:hypothetical protein
MMPGWNDDQEFSVLFADGHDWVSFVVLQYRGLAKHFVKLLGWN